MRHPVGDGWVDRVLGHVAFGPEVVVACAVLLQSAALFFHLVRCLPSAQYHFTHTSHGLGIGGHHRYRTQIMQDVFGCDGLASDA